MGGRAIANGGPSPVVLSVMGQYLSVPIPAPLDVQAILKAEKEAKRTKVFLLRNAGLPSCPRRLPQMTALREVDLSSNRIAELPFEIGELIKLRKLNVSHNLLALLPESIGTCVLLKVLNAAHNTLEQIPDTIGQLLRLEHADFTGEIFHHYNLTIYLLLSVQSRCRELPQRSPPLPGFMRLACFPQVCLLASRAVPTCETSQRSKRRQQPDI